ncbi:IclR family transcriptional regulator [Halomicrobium urmianum]|uniref:IclR family transcriptional regulator n=1 Tax=Halomicrobium urmianum TaxID=1586233 RepID=UPI001CDA11CB|nr:IclR family transcriptional regulator [Halomicrobium urmianum]
MTESGRYEVEATGTSIAIFEALVAAEDGLGVTALARETDLSKSVVHNHLSTLQAHGYVVKRDGTYEPSLRPLAQGDQTRENLAVYGAARGEIDNLASATGETTALFVREADSAVPVYVARGGENWSPPFREGERFPLHATAPGKSLMTSVPAERLTELIDGMDLSAADDASDPEEFREQLRQVRDDGIAFSRAEHLDGVVGVAAPIPSTNGSRPAALAVCGPIERLNGRYLEEDIAGQVLSTSTSIQVALTSE